MALIKMSVLLFSFPLMHWPNSFSSMYTLHSAHNTCWIKVDWISGIKGQCISECEKKWTNCAVCNAYDLDFQPLIRCSSVHFGFVHVYDAVVIVMFVAVCSFFRWSSGNSGNNSMQLHATTFGHSVWALTWNDDNGKNEMLMTHFLDTHTKCKWNEFCERFIVHWSMASSALHTMQL